MEVVVRKKSNMEDAELLTSPARKRWGLSGAQTRFPNGESMEKRYPRRTISEERLAALGWPGPNPRVGIIQLARRVNAFREADALVVSFGGDPVLRVMASELHIAHMPVMQPAALYALVREVSEALGYGRVELKSHKGRLTAAHNGAIYLADKNGDIAITLY